MRDAAMNRQPPPRADRSVIVEAAVPVVAAAIAALSALGVWLGYLA
jgi:hypothetical protein